MIFEYSLWWIFPILVLSAAVAWLKFKKISKLPDIPFGLALFISSLRFAVLFVLLFLLLKPTLSFVRNRMEKPLLIIAQDNSASLLNNKDSLYYRNEYEESLKNKIAQLEDKFTVEWLTFGSDTKKSGSVDFSENHTDISGIFDYIADNYYKRPEALLLLSDGLYNTGVNPRYKMIPYPVYSVALGDTVETPDVYVRNLESDKFNFIKTIFPIKTEIVAVKQKGKSIRCILRENGNTIKEEVVLIDADNFVKEIVFEAEAKQKGVVKYTVSLESEFAERSKANNQASTFVNILDNSGEIAVYYTAPHPDIAALLNAINVSGIYSCSAHRFTDPLTEIKSNLILLHNPEPEDPNYQKIVELAAKRKVSLWYILTTRKSIQDFARFGKAYTADFSTEVNEYATISFNREFPFFEFTEQEINGFTAYPPVVVPFGEIKSIAGRPLFTQKIKNTLTGNGLLSFYDNNDFKTCYFWGEGLWKWRLFSYKESGNHELFNLLINKIVSYLATQKGNDRFINDIQALYDETDKTVVNVELYNDSYELVNTPDVKLWLKYEDKDFNYILNRNRDKYRIDLGNLPAGEYRYTLSTNLKGEDFEKQGLFFVRTQNPELNDVVANRELLGNISNHSGGQMVSMDNLDQLIQSMDQDSHFKPNYKSEVKQIDLSEIKWLGIILLFLICIEWFFLKYFVG